MQMRVFVDKLDELSVVAMKADTIGPCDRVKDGQTCIQRERKFDQTNPDKLCDP
jgi:hypothetical protein